MSLFLPSSLQPWAEPNWRPAGKGVGEIHSLQAFSSGDTEKSIRSAGVPKEMVSLLGDDEFVIVGMGREGIILN